MVGFNVLSVSAVLMLMHFVASSSEDGLQLVQIVFRHGDRAPVSLYPNDPNPESVWVEGLGKLTKLGRQQHYALGKFFRRGYEDFITTSPNEIYVQSSEEDRCLRSAQTNLASFYAPTPKWSFAKDLPWQPIPVHYIPQEKDKYLRIDSYCPKASEEEKRIMNSPEVQGFLNQYKGMFLDLTNFSGAKIDDWRRVVLLFDTLQVEKKYNLLVPSWADEYWEELNFLSDQWFYWAFNSKLIQRLRAGPLLGLILENMRNKTFEKHDEYGYGKKVNIYSGHGENVAVVLNALDLFNMKIPPLCSALIFELHRLSGNHFVRLVYLNSSTPELGTQVPHVLEINGCSEYCPLDFFAHSIKDLIPEDWDAECKVKFSNSSASNEKVLYENSFLWRDQRVYKY